MIGILTFLIKKSTKSGKYKKIKIFPYFLAAGKHVLADIPNIIKEFKTNHKDIEFTVLAHFGQCNGVEDLIL
ncbi:CbiX/SirB N-terminal domain-containing protein, partial [Aliarcobacter butzleri]|uniref:CbiX/SirB N-terminal domain-containing protein n=1 Tax=Aliarcobacter butzleri TaxID=28197 RepID=UPI00396AF395